MRAVKSLTLNGSSSGSGLVEYSHRHPTFHNVHLGKVVSVGNIVNGLETPPGEINVGCCQAGNLDKENEEDVKVYSTSHTRDIFQGELKNPFKNLVKKLCCRAVSE